MKKTSIIILVLIFCLNAIFTTGCWNYREIDQLSIVAGLAIDKGIKEKFQMTVELIKISGGKDTKMESKTISAEGKTMFDAARNIIALSGKRLYWSHTKVIIISKEIASEGIIQVMDWYNRDAETREDVNILISKDESAKEIFSGQDIVEDIKSITLDEIIKNQVALSKSPLTDILKYDIESKNKEDSIIIPTVKLEKIDEKMVPQVLGTAIIKNDKLIGFLDAEDTKALIFIRNEIKGGLLTEEIQASHSTTSVSLEIFKNKTIVTPVVDGKDITINLNIDTTVAIDEIQGTENLIDDEGKKKLEQFAEKKLQERIETLIMKVQSEYDADIFRFAAKLREGKPKVWKNMRSDWEEVFKNLKVNVKTKLHIKGSSVLSKTIGEGE